MRKSAPVVVVEVLVEKGDFIAAWAGGNLERRRKTGRPVPFVASGELREACARGETRVGGGRSDAGSVAGDFRRQE